MKLTVQTAAFRSAFSRVASTCSSKPPRACLGSVLWSGNRLTATDLEYWLSVEIGDAASEPILLNAMKVGQILASATAPELTISTNKTTVTLESGGKKWSLPLADPSEFPTDSAFAPNEIVRVPCATLTAAILATHFAADVESTRFALGSVCLYPLGKKLAFIAADSRRMSWVETGIPFSSAPVLIPSIRARSIAKGFDSMPGDATIEISPNAVRISCGGTTVRTSQVEGRYVRAEDVIPSPSRLCEIPRDVLIDALRAVAVTTTQESQGVDFAANVGDLRLSTETADVGQSDVTIPLSGEFASMTINGAYLLQWLQAMADGVIEIRTESDEHGVLLSSGDCRYVLMPMVKGGE